MKSSCLSICTSFYYFSNFFIVFFFFGFYYYSVTVLFYTLTVYSFLTQLFQPLMKTSFVQSKYWANKVVNPVFRPEKKPSLGRGQSSPAIFLSPYSFDLTACSRGQRLSGHLRKPNSKHYRAFLSQPGSGLLIRLAKRNENMIRYWTMQTLRIVITLSHLRALHDALRKTFLKVTNIKVNC